MSYLIGQILGSLSFLGPLGERRKGGKKRRLIAKKGEEEKEEEKAPTAGAILPQKLREAYGMGEE